MTDLSPMSDLVADDLLLNRLGGRMDAGPEPVAALLGALAAHADTPLPGRTARRRSGNRHRYIGAFAALAVAASGAGVAAAVSLPDRGLSQAERARIEQQMEQSARSTAPSALLTRLGLPQTSGTTLAHGLVLARAADGSFTLLPASVVAAQATTPNGLALGPSGSNGGNAQGGGGQGGNAQGGGQGGGGSGGNAQGNTGNTGGSGGGSSNDDGDSQGGTGTTSDSKSGNTGKGVNNGKKAPAPTPTPTPTSTTDATVTSTTIGRSKSGSGARATSSPTPDPTSTSTR